MSDEPSAEQIEQTNEVNPPESGRVFKNKISNFLLCYK